MKIRQLARIQDIPGDQWDSLLDSAYPFMRHDFLAALEDSGSVCAERGWEPAHLVVIDEAGQLQAALPLYRKMHSYGEYVFDFQWAQAWERSGREYYPKYLAAVPFSPVQGPRLLARCEQSRGMILEHLDQELDQAGVSGMHVLFNQGEEDDALQGAGWVQRLGCQFHWFNRGYAGFDDFLGACNSRKRKNFRKERLAVAEQGISFHWLTGKDLTPAVWDQFYPFYAATYLKRGQHPYLTPEFFQMLSVSMPEAIRLVFARHDGRNVAGAFFLADQRSLYGRYWGCLEEYDRLHFETCFYQGMERCIAEGLERFDAGAQGEHKLIRGFEPVLTQSWHKLQEPLHDAVADFLLREREGVKKYQEESRDYLPYRQAE